MVISLVVSQLLHLFFSEKNSGMQPDDQHYYKVILKQGVVGCITQDKFDLVQKLYSQNDLDAIKKILNNKECFVFVKDEEFIGPKTNCDNKSKITDSFAFSSKKFQLSKIILPCFAFKVI